VGEFRYGLEKLISVNAAECKKLFCNGEQIFTVPYEVYFCTFYCCTEHFDKLKFLSPTNAPLYYTYKMLKCTVKISAVEKDPKHYINELIIDMVNAVRQMEPKLQNTFRYLATKKNQTNYDNHHVQHYTKDINTT
jgi:hypothetical protein